MSMLPSFASRLCTNRLELMPLDAHSDTAGILHPHITENVTKLWIGWDVPCSIEDTRLYVQDALQRTRDGHYLGWIARKNYGDQSFIGMVSVEYIPEPMRGAHYELNFWLAEENWGKGYAYEMAAVVLDWLSLRSELLCLTLSWTHGNERSKKVIERICKNQEPEIHPAMKNNVELAVYHYVIQLNDWHRRQWHRKQI